MPRLAVLAVALRLAGCQTTVRYEPKGESGSFGCSSQSVSARHFVVMFEGDPLTELSQMRDFALLRAAELTRDAGGTHFKVVAEQSVIKRRLDEMPSATVRTPSPEWAGTRGRTFNVERDYPVAWFEIEIYTAAQPATPDQTDVLDAVETQATLAKRYHLNARDRT